MHAFSRFASFLLFVFSLGLIASALPTAPGGNNALATRYGEDKATILYGLIADLDVKIKADVDVCLKAKTLDEVKIVVDTISADVQACAKAIVALGPVKLDANVEADIAAKIAAIILVIIKACVDISVKFGLEVVIAVFAKIDLALKCLLVNIGICVEGILVLIAKIVVSTCNDLFVKLNFKLCLAVLAAVRL
ncbi:hypothetical protein RSOLAG22IIIB_12861 [Rhizoctonia solani]|uniref:Transmembrane protein n=1 Tax=Rhizoctonia solani TaxID=456999 RepID=A0A0K6GGV1_9AGAM|nr:hypothetical protein RSOLAG22IIIB_12861 [Rhizoctonia solani]